MQKKTKKRGYIASTEPAARKVQAGIKKRMQKKVQPKNGRTLSATTAKSPKGVMKTPAQSKASYDAAKERQRKRVEMAKKKRQKPTRGK